MSKLAAGLNQLKNVVSHSDFRIEKVNSIDSRAFWPEDENGQAEFTDEEHRVVINVTVSIDKEDLLDI